MPLFLSSTRTGRGAGHDRRWTNEAYALVLTGMCPHISSHEQDHAERQNPSLRADAVLWHGDAQGVAAPGAARLRHRAWAERMLTQFTILAEVALRAKAPPSMAELAQALVMDRSALGHNLQPLQRDGLIALKKSDTDRRRRHVILTAKGRTKYREAGQLWQRAQDRFSQVFGEFRRRETARDHAGHRLRRSAGGARGLTERAAPRRHRYVARPWIASLRSQ